MKIRVFSADEKFEWGGVKGIVFTLRGERSSGETNDKSLVVELEGYRCTALFTGDIEKSAEATLLRRGLKRATLLKVPHHGSKTSSTPGLLQRVKPRWAIISVGQGNTYGHPHSGVLARYVERGIQVLRTDFHGYVRFTINESGSIACQSSLGPCGTYTCF